MQKIPNLMVASIANCLERKYKMKDISDVSVAGSVSVFG